MKAYTRKDCYFGLHFDFHAMEGETVGEIIDLTSIERMLDEVKPDMIQIDTKGHPGISSYMTKVGRRADTMNMDVLKVWRQLTKERGIRLYAHHSGLYDRTQALLHPEWAVVSAQGDVSQEYVSSFSPYVDEILIPQLLEIAKDYEVDGAWVDGECWGSFVDYSEYAQQAWHRETGLETPYPEDIHYEEYREFCREGFRRYVAHYIQSIKKEVPDFEITSNWIYSHYMPEKQAIPVDFLSGDYTCHDSVRSARAIARCLSNQDTTWDLIAWGHNAYKATWVTRDRCTKESTQLCQEAAIVLSQGGGFILFNILYGTGGLIQEWAIPSWKQVEQFCRERQEFCFHTKSASDIAVVYPQLYGEKQLFMGEAWKNVRNWVNMIADIGYSCDVIYEADLRKLQNYKIVVLPHARAYKNETFMQMKEYVYNGGKIIADGGVMLDEELSGVRFSAPDNRLLFLDNGEELTAMVADYYTPSCSTAKELLYFYKQNYYYESEKGISAVINQGNVISLCVNLGSVYNENITYALKQYVKAIFKGSGYMPVISVEGSEYAEISLMKKDDSIMVNIVNRAGEHDAIGVRTFREIPKIGPLTVTIRTEKKPREVIWQPEGRSLTEIPFEEKETADGYRYLIGDLGIHGIVEIRY